MPLRYLLKTMRPKQWAKNGFVFAALIFDGQLFWPASFLHTLAGFILFCLLSSIVYIVNDISDLDADRLHPKKRLRPLAAGKLSVRTAWVAVFVLLIIVFPLAFWLSPGFFLISLGYFLLNLAYSRWLKHIIVLDVVVLAAFYVIRVAAGVELIKVARFSPWLYVFTIFLALFLGVGKRRAERNLLMESASDESSAQSHRKVLAGYTLPLLDQYLNIVSSMTIITYSLYTFSAPNLPENHLMMLTIPFVIYGIFRYLYLVQVEKSGGAPEEVLFTDRPLQIALVLFGLVILVVFYLPSIYSR
jgi:4-hydroxybenzoate polyprenyltransferase